MNEAATVTYEEAWRSLKRLWPDPVGGLDVAYAALPKDRVIPASLGLALLGVVTGFVGCLLLVPSFVRNEGKVFLYLLLMNVGGPLAMAGVCFLAQKVFAASADFSACMFLAASANLPTSIAVLIMGTVGIANVEVVVTLLVFSLCYMVLMLHSGLVRILKIGELWASFCVSVVLVVDIWLQTVFFRAL